MEKLASDMRRLTPLEHVQRTSMVGRLGMPFKELPFSRLEPLHKHKYGVLKAWVKGKTFKTGMPATWSAVAWRPIAGYSSHRWRHLLGIAGRWCTHTVAALKWGWPCTSPRTFVSDVMRFNDEQVPMPVIGEQSNNADGEESKDLSVDIQDLEGFFPNINMDEVEIAVELAISELRANHAKWQYF